jgi:phenylalanyl-tRNA synthetase alpha subunit
VPAIHDILTKRLDPAWKPGEPSVLLADYGERMSALAQAEPQIARATASYAGAIAGADDLPTLQSIRNAALSRESGAFPEALALMPTLSVEEKRVSGKALNLGKALVEAAEKAKRESLESAREGDGDIDVTLPGRRPWTGRPHVLAQVREELLDLFHGLGFSVYTSSEVELETTISAS